MQKARERFLWQQRKVSRSGEKPEPTVIVRMEEGLRQEHDLARDGVMGYG